ncbi:phage gp6-like head-tail connector protein [Weissella coleopterorum]|uniref:Phage gp6-like head-tail connector protein n=1 Tax=Weissella coleopterorum TaxID=2714949 RepID=A0A6G8AY18_9LACO|nr:head-tail connector protein [Weissella coleopterorum]QIL49859.1 phage gp6-like head-tail connector protein [Weissella coleopterorum]
MADEVKLLEPETLMNELHIDVTDEEKNTIKALINDASVIIRGSIKDDLTESQILKSNGLLFNRLISALATQLYYDRSLSTGYSAGVQIMINQLRARVLGGEDETK